MFVLVMLVQIYMMSVWSHVVACCQDILVLIERFLATDPKRKFLIESFK